MKFKRIFLIIIDSLGVGEAIDADSYNDKGANTLGHINDTGNLFIPNLKKIGLLNTLIMNNQDSDAYYTIARPKNKLNDSVSSHYELMGVSDANFKSFKDQFPRDMLEKIARTIQKPIIGNINADIMKAINQLAKRHRETGALIIYTTGDSNIEIACDESIVPVNTLYDYCEKIRDILTDDAWRVSSVIARPFKQVDGVNTLTGDSRRYTLNPPSKSVLDSLKENNLQTISIGKINDIFNNVGITKIIKASSNNEGINKLINIMDKNFEGLCFLNLNDFDALYGHARDVVGYQRSLEELDVEIPIIINKLDLDDLLIISADHGCDPTFDGHKHTRENVPVIAYSRSFSGSGQLDIMDSLADIGATIAENFELEKPWIGNSFFDKLK